MEPTLYQWIHCRYGRIRRLTEHVALLRQTARTLFGWTVRPDLAALEAEIGRRVKAQQQPASFSHFVRLELTAVAWRLTAVETSLYDGYALRSLHPQAITLPYDHPFGVSWTTAAEAADRVAEEAARAHGAEAAIRCNGEGTCLGWGAAPLFALHDNELTTAETPRSVEGGLLLEAAQRLGLHPTIAPLHRGALSRYDELLAVDHRGITAFGRCDGHPFITLKAERLATEMERLVSVR